METVKQVASAIKETIMGDEPEDKSAQTFTMMNGCPFAHNKHSLTAGPHGPVIASDASLLDKLLHFNREKIPPRNVHALGVGAYGTLTITSDEITKYSSAKLFSHVGKKTDFFTRFSGIFTEQGEADTSRDPRGFAIKFYTEEGNWDLLGINTPVFNVRDAKLGPDAVHACKRDPRTFMWHPSQTWDFCANHPEGLHQFMMLYTDRIGTPMSYRHMHAYGCHTFSLINYETNKRYWVKFHILAKNGAKGFDKDRARLVAGYDPNFLSRDLISAIERGDYPKWRFCFQVMPEEEGYKHHYAFDCTKVWKHADYPLYDIGEIEVNRNVVDYFSEVEQAAFAPTNMVPGIGPSPDRLLQGRMLIYDDTQFHRVGSNFKQLPVNRPHNTDVKCMRVGGYMNTEVRNVFPHYADSSYGSYQPNPKLLEPPLKCDGPAGFYDWPLEGTDADYYAQPRDLWKVLSDTDKNNLCENLADSFNRCDDIVVKKMLFHLDKIDPVMGSMVEGKLQAYRSGNRAKTEMERVIEETNRMLGVVSDDSKKKSSAEKKRERETLTEHVGGSTSKAGSTNKSNVSVTV